MNSLMFRFLIINKARHVKVFIIILNNGLRRFYCHSFNIFVFPEFRKKTERSSWQKRNQIPNRQLCNQR